MLTVGSLFSGIGGIELGLERSGMSVKWQVERDEWCRKVLAKHWPEVPRFGDIKEFPGEAQVAPVDLVCGGFPCQPVSYSGKRKAQGDERWLWPEFSRVLCELRPRFAVIENVPGMLTAGASDVVFDLAEIGYDAEWRVLATEDFGAPHKRERLFIVGWKPEEGFTPGWFAGSVLTDPDIKGLEVGKCLGRSFQPEVPTAQRSAVESVENWWSSEPGVGRLVHGVSDELDRRERIRGLGNAVVPQVAEFVGRVILKQLESK